MLHDYCLISFIFDLQGLTRKYLTLISENYTNHYIRLHFEVYVYRFSLKSIPKKLSQGRSDSFVHKPCVPGRHFDKYLHGIQSSSCW